MLIKAEWPTLGIGAQRRNLFINGGMNVQQRATLTGITDAGTYYGKVDRWAARVSGTGISYSLGASDFSGVATGQGLFIGSLAMTNGTIRIMQRIESLNCQNLANKNVTISGICFHDFGVDSNFRVVVEKPNAKDDFTAVTLIQSGAGVVVPSGVATRVSFTLTIANEAVDGLQISFQSYDPRTVTGKTVGLAEAQFEIGPTFTPFEFRHFSEEVAMCQRYYEKSYNLSSTPGLSATAGRLMRGAARANDYYTDRYKVPKRNATHTVIIYSPQTGASGKAYDHTASADVNAGTPTTGETGFVVSLTAVATNLYSLQWTASSEL